MEPAATPDLNEKEEENSKNNNLNELISDLKNKINNIQKEKNDEIRALKNIISEYSLNMKQMSEKILNLEKKVGYLEEEIVLLKSKNIDESNNQNRISEKIGVYKPLRVNDSLKDEDGFVEIENPWTDENKNYILYKSGYVAELINSYYMYPVKSKLKLDKNRIYKLIYNISYFSGKFRVGFGDLGLNNKQLKEKGSVGLTGQGLFNEGEKISDVKLQKENKQVIFIINLKNNQKYFEVFIDGKSLGKFNFDLEDIYGLASMHNGSVQIKTLRSLV